MNQRKTKGSSKLQRLWRRDLFPVKDKTLCGEESLRSGKNIPAVVVMALSFNDTFTQLLFH